MKAGLGGGLQLVVQPDLIDVRTPGELSTRLLRWLGADCRLRPSESNMELERVGWLGSASNERECIVLSGVSLDGRAIQIAIDPQADLGTTWRALRAVGVTAAGPGPD